VRFTSRLVVELERPELPLLRPEGGRDLSLPPVVVCCMCADAAEGDTWAPVEEVLAARRLLELTPPPPLQHVVCDTCVARTLDGLAVATDRS
jgi:hypothetical protein